MFVFEIWRKYVLVKVTYREPLCLSLPCLWIFADFLSSMPNKANNSTFFLNFPISDLNWHVIQKISKNSQKWEHATSKGMFWVQKAMQNWFLEYLSIFSLFWTRSGKKTVFCVIFSKMVIFGQNLTLPMCFL